MLRHWRYSSGQTVTTLLEDIRRNPASYVNEPEEKACVEDLPLYWNVGSHDCLLLLFTFVFFTFTFHTVYILGNGCVTFIINKTIKCMLQNKYINNYMHFMEKWGMIRKASQEAL